MAGMRAPLLFERLSWSWSQIMEDLVKLCCMREGIRAFLDGVEERKIRVRPTRVWLDKLRGVDCDAEDVIEEFKYELLQYQLACEEEEREIKMERKVIDSLLTPPIAPPMLDPSFQFQIATKIKKVNDLFDEIHRVKSLYMEDAVSLWNPRRSSSCFLKEKTRIVGREDHKRGVIKMMLDIDEDNCCLEDVRVVSVVGMAGVGKTALAQLVYGDDVVAYHFDTRLWVCVSDNFDVIRLTREILKNILPRSIHISELERLQRMLTEELKGKRFLLVLDDVWNESRQKWEALARLLLSGAPGSRVLITTRSEEVSRISGVSERNTYRLGCLSYADSCSLFDKFAFKNRDSRDSYPNLVAIGQQIVQKCEGLPLTVITLAALLCSESNEDVWEAVLRSELSQLLGVDEAIFSVLTLSYDHLPLGIRPCFAYCAGFPKGHNFDREDLVLLWMAQGYINSTTQRSMEENGQSYFEHLLHRSFFQSYGGECFGMHDLIHPLARSVSLGESSKLEGGELSDRWRKPRHIWFESEEDMTKLLTCHVIDNFRHLRTLYMIGKSRRAFSSKVLDDMFLHMRSLRALDLGAAEVSELPDSISGLKHLRYLCVSSRQLRRLPESLGNLLFLQTLIVKRAQSLEELPMCLRKLVNLRYLKLHKF